MSRWLKSTDKVRDSATRAAHGALDHAVRAFLSPWHFFKVLCFLIGFVVISATVSGAVYAFNFVRSLPKVDRLDAKSMEIIAKGKVNDRLENKKKRYRWTDIKDVSREYIYAIVMSEDATFFEHSGFNFEAIADSLAENIKERRAAFGGSTISQQVAKNMFLTREKTLNRKIKEVFITRQLEARFTKNEILEMYLNIAELGPDIYGVDAAAWHYFRKSPRNINAAEGVFIALMLPSPKKNYFSIYQNKNLSRVRRRRLERVLRAMLYEEILTEKQYQQYVRYNYFAEDGRSPAARTKGE